MDTITVAQGQLHQEPLQHRFAASEAQDPSTRPGEGRGKFTAAGARIFKFERVTLSTIHPSGSNRSFQYIAGPRDGN